MRKNRVKSRYTVGCLGLVACLSAGLCVFPAAAAERVVLCEEITSLG